MTRKLMLLLAAIAALAFAVPTTAGAAEATCPAGTRCPVGTQITMTGKDITLTSSVFGAKTCAALNLNITLIKNDGTTVEANGENANPTQAECKSSSAPFTVTSFTVNKLFANGSGTGPTKPGTMSFTTVIDTGSVKCSYTGTNVPFSYTYKTDVIKFANAAGIVGVPQACGTAKLDGEFTLEKRGTNVAVILD